MNFQSFGQTVKGRSRDHEGKSKGKTEQAQKVRAKPVGRNQLGVKMQLSHNFLIVPCYYIICFGCLMGFNMLFILFLGLTY